MLQDTEDKRKEKRRQKVRSDDRRCVMTSAGGTQQCAHGAFAHIVRVLYLVLRFSRSVLLSHDKLDTVAQQCCFKQIRRDLFSSTCTPLTKEVVSTEAQFLTVFDDSCPSAPSELHRVSVPVRRQPCLVYNRLLGTMSL